MAFKISIVSDFSQWLRGTKDVEKSLDDIADSLDDLAKETSQNADKAADDLSREFRDAFDKVKTESKQTGKRLGTDLKEGTDKAGEGFDDLKDEANESAREAAASFTGEFDDVADYVQEVLAQALSGFGPAGAAAGIAAAAGIGILIGKLQEAEEKAHEAQERINTLADDLMEVEGNPELLDWLGRIKGVVQEIADKKEWYEFWQTEDITVGQQVLKLAKDYNLTAAEQADILRARAGDNDAAARTQQVLNDKLDEQWRLNQQIVDSEGNVINSRQAQINALEEQKASIANVSEENREAQEQIRQINEAERGRTKAIQEAKESNDQFAASLRDNISVLDDYGDKIIKNGKINFKEWARLQKQAAKDNKLIIEFDAEAKLSPEAQRNVRALPKEQQLILAKEWKKNPQKVETFIENEVKVQGDVKPASPIPPVKVPTEVDTSAVDDQVTAARNNAQDNVKPIKLKVEVDTPTINPPAPSGPVKFVTDVDESKLPSQVAAAGNKAQGEANKESNKIQYKTKIDGGDLQRQVNRAAASIHVPTITIKTRVDKEVP